ncbi:MAG: hypothetical protein CMN02_01930 [Roseibacillus sp.]|nr:hypothetical protein [Roseibacillus sp.]|tara:strand:+ start:679 stop:993 length:315 start_codon:yes stop_codon:yes gene_type:complete
MANYEPKTPGGFLIGILIPAIVAIPPWTGRYCYINFSGNCIKVDAFALFFWAPLCAAVAIWLIGHGLSIRGHNGLLKSTKITIPLTLVYGVLTHWLFLVGLGSI